MNMLKEKVDRRAWIIGGTTLIGFGVGFVFLALYQSGLLFVASIVAGIGLGLLLAPLFSMRKS